MRRVVRPGFAVAGLVTAVLASVGSATGLPAANAAPAGTSSGPRPGPAILYAPPVVAPQLTNAGVWRAKPILVSGTSAYRSGEFLYQDYLYDDHGANAARDPQDPKSGDT